MHSYEKDQCTFNLWPEIVRATVYLHNRTPNYRNRWKTPYELFLTYTGFHNGTATRAIKPNLSHLKAFGCKAFAMTDDTQLGKGKLMRLDAKAWVAIAREYYPLYTAGYA